MEGVACSAVQSDHGFVTPEEEEEEVAVAQEVVKEEGEVKRERTPSPPSGTE